MEAALPRVTPQKASHTHSPRMLAWRGLEGLLHVEAVSLGHGQQSCFFPANILQKMTWLQARGMGIPLTE